MQHRTLSKWNRIIIGALLTGVASAALVACGGDDGGGYSIALLAPGVTARLSQLTQAAASTDLD